MKKHNKPKRHLNEVLAKTHAEFKAAISQRFSHLTGSRIEFIIDKAHVFLTNSAAPTKFTWVPVKA